MERPNRMGLLKKMQRLRHAKLSPLMLMVSEYGKVVGDNDSALVLTAWGNMLQLNDQPNFIAPFSYESAITIAEVLATKMSSTTATQSMRMAAFSGQLTASWIVSTPPTIESQHQAYQKVMENLRYNTPTEQTFKQVYNHIIKVAKANTRLGTVVTRDECCVHMSVSQDQTFTLNLPPQISFQKSSMLYLGVNAMLFPFVSEAGLRAHLDSLTVMDCENVILEDDIDIELIAEPLRKRAWGELPDEHILAFYHNLGCHLTKTLQGKALSAIMMQLIHITKGGNTTDAYFTRRIAAITEALPQFGLEQHLTRDYLMSYSRMFPFGNFGVDDIFRMLQVMYTFWSEYNLEPLKWHIEQAAASNVTAAVSIANMIVRHPHASFWRICNIIGADQFNKWATVAAHVCYDRYCSIVSPPVPMPEYADLAYIGIYVSIKSSGGSTYRGRPDNRARLTITALDQISITIMKSAEMNINNDEYVREQLQALHQDDIVILRDDDFYIVPNLPGDATPEQRDERNTFMARAARGDWVREFRTHAPMGTSRMSKEQAIVRTNELDDSRIFKNNLMIIATALLDASRQETIDIVPLGQLNETQRRKVIPVVMQRALTALGVELIPAWIAPHVPEIPLVQPVDNDRMNRYKRTWWGLLPINERAADRQVMAGHLLPGHILHGIAEALPPQAQDQQGLEVADNIDDEGELADIRGVFIDRDDH